MKMNFNNKKFRYGSASIIFTALFVAVVVVLNIFAGFLTDRFSLKVDMTSSGQYSLSDECKEAISSLPSDVKIYILSAEADAESNETSRKTLETVQRFASASKGKIRYEFIDPDKNPAFFREFEKAKNAHIGDLVVAGENRYMIVNSTEFAYTIGNSNKIYYQREELITSAILYVTAEEVSKAAFTTGHGETRPDALYSHFSGNNFEVSEADLLGEVPEDVKNLVISKPSEDFAPQEIENLEKFLSRDGANLYVFWGMEVKELPTLERYLAEWGIAFETQVVLDSENSYMAENIVLSDVVSSAAFDSSLQGDYSVLSTEARPIKLLFDESGYVKTNALVKTKSTSYAKSISADKKIKSFARAAGDVAGPFTVCAMAENTYNIANGRVPSRVLVFGSYGMAAEEVCAVPRAFNTKLFALLCDYANPNTKTISISPKVDVSYDLDLTERTAAILKVVLIAVIPLIIIALAVYVFIKRKNR